MSLYRYCWLLFVLVFASCKANVQEDQQGGDQTVAVVTAAREMGAGQIVDLDYLKKLRLPASCVTADLVKAADAEQICGRLLQVSLKKGEPLRLSILAEQEWSRLSTIVRKRGRALTLAVAGLGWVRPNDHVDIVATLPDPESGKLSTVTLIQNVIVLSVGSQSGLNATRPPDPKDPLAGTVTFMLLPEEVERVVAAARTGSLTVSLRNPEDVSGEESRRPVQAADLFEGAKE